ncbi:MAG: class I tRNA ligase family protein, partial [Thermodesulfobacteriota bacterium]
DPFSRSFDGSMNQLQYHHALTLIWEAIRELNGYVEKTAPWKLAKEGDEETLSNVLYTLAEGLRIVAVYLYPFMPEAALKIWGQLGIDAEIENCSFDKEVEVGGREIAGLKVDKGAPLFPRVE